MANLGSENTPIEGESFGLPSGYSFDEENGDLVIRDTDGTVAMRRADGTWELESDLALSENDISGVGAFDSESVNTDGAVIDGTFFASTFDGEDADSRLADAVSNLSSGDGKLILEQHEYQSDITLQERNRYAGQWGRHNSGCRFNSEVTTGTNVYIEYVGIDNDGEIIVDGPDNMLSNIVMRADGDITVQDDRCVISSVTGFGGTITFESDTENGEIGVVSENTTVTDNGNNSIL